MNHTQKIEYKTLLIDLDGTLLGAHTFRLHLYFSFHFIKALGQYGFGFIAAALLLHKLKLSMRDLAHQKNGVLNWTKAVAFFSQLSGKNLAQSQEILTTTALQCFQKSKSTLFAKPEAIEFIAWAKQHFRLILATNPLWPLEVVLYRLAIAEIHQSNFEFITHAENMSASKPHIEYYQELSALKNLEPQTCLMIGNDEKKDGPARLIGIEVFIIERPSDFKKLQAKLEAKLHNEMI